MIAITTLTFRGAGALCAAALIGVPGAVAQTVPLKIAAPVGTEIDFEQQTDMTLDLDLSMQGTSMQMQQVIATTVKGTSTVLGLGPDDVPNEVRVSFDPASSMSLTAMGQTQSPSYPLAGKTYTLTRTNGTVTIAPADGLDDAARADLEAYLDFGQDALPTTQVAVGESWQGTLSLGAGEAPATGTFTLTGLQDGQGAAALSFAVPTKTTMQGMTMDGTGQGTSLVDLATGLPTRIDFKIDAAISGAMTEGGMNAQVGGKAVGTTTLRSVIRAPGRTAGALEPAAPAVPPAGSAALDGDWQGEALSAKIEGDTLVLSLGGQVYQGRIATRTEESFEGSFTAAGSAFPVTGRVSGSTLTVSSGGTDYPLTRASSAAPNPLGR